ncbi:MAG: DsrE/DsrF/DrsH-like family protein [Thermodesulfobacteriota bacterium]
MAADPAGGKKPYRLCIVLHAGSFDRVYEALAIANVEVARGGEAHVLFTYGALKRLRKGNTDLVVIEGEPAPFREEFEKALERGTTDSISEMIEMGKRFGGLKIYACSGAMGILNITRDELIDGVDASTGLVGFMDLVKEANLTLYV